MISKTRLQALVKAFRVDEVSAGLRANPALLGFRDKRGRNWLHTALHYMLKKNSDKQHYGMFVEHGARGDIPDPDGDTASARLRRKRDPFYREIADQLESN